MEEVLSHYRLVVNYMPEYGEHADPGIMEAKITKLEILYNGFSAFQSPMASNPHGLIETGDPEQPFDGQIRPVLRFTFDHGVEKEAAMHSLESTCFQFMTPAMDEEGEVYELSDHNGWSEVIDEDTEYAVGDALADANLATFNEEEGMVVFKTLRFETGMDTHGHVIEWPHWFAKKE